MKQFKRGLAFLLVLVMMVTSMGVGVMAAPAKTKKASIKSVTITKPDTKTLVMKKGKTFTIKKKVTTTGKGKISKAVTFSSSNKKVATVSAKGKIKALKNGKTTITVRSKANKKKKATLKVVVKTPVTKVTLDQKTLELIEGETATLTATVTPKNATVKKVKFTSNKPEIVKVSSKGTLTAVKEGTAVITVTSTDGNGKKATCTVIVRKKAQDTPDKDDTNKDDTNKDNTNKDDTNKDDTEKPGDDDKKPEEKPVEKLSYEGFELKWKDDFDSVSLNSADWNVELHEPGWVNAEWQEYVDSEENIYLKDGNLVIKPVRKQTGVDEDNNPIYEYTSGRVNTQGKHDFTYGLFEARIKVPTGQGYLPAFWMMPTDENLYGQWPRCGEIDIMEVMGQDTTKVMGTLHYGNPHAQTQGESVLKSGDFSSEYHTYAVEWEPGKIKWYVDGVKYHEANDWFTTTEGQGTVAYPAPFDQPFYMILNLAIGGSWVGYPDETTTYEDQAFTIDYVKAYQKDKTYYDNLEATVEKPEKAPVVEPEDGKYVQNSDFSAADDLSGENGSNWKFMTQQGGEGTAKIVKDEKLGGNAVKISTTKAGNEEYAVQFVQANIPVKQGGKYQLSFDAYAATDRTMIVDVSAPDYNYARYMNDTKVSLGTEKQSYSFEFTVNNHDDANARVEFNLGKTSPISDVFITNVVIKKIGQEEIDNSKKVMTDGNYVSNGKFQEGTEVGKKFMQYWDVVTSGNAKATAAVTDLADGRRMKITSSGCVSENSVVLQQTELPLTAGKYQLSFDGQVDGLAADADSKVRVNVAGQTFEAELTNDKKDYVYKFEIPESAEIADINDIVFEVGANGTVLLDNVRIVEDTLIKNGSFNADLAGFEVYAYTPSDVSYTVDSQTEDKAFDITIKNTNDADWKIQLKQNNVTLEKDQWYNLTFKVKSSIARKISYAIQRNGAVHKDEKGGEDWTPYVQNVVELPAYGDNGTYETVSVDFKMNYDTDEGSIFNIAMGAVKDEKITEQHRICIDNIVLEKIDEPEDLFPEIPAGTNLIQNADFADGKDNWSETIANWGGEFVADAESSISENSVSGNAITYAINNTGTDDWHVQLKQNDIPIHKDKTYVLEFDVCASMDRTIHYAVQRNGEKNGGIWDAYQEADVDLTAGETKHVEVEFSPDEIDKYAALSISMGQIAGQQITTTHTVTLSHISLMEKKPENLFINGNFASGTDGWNPYILSADLGTITNVGGKLIYNVKNPGTEEWNVKLTQEPMTLEAGKKYRLQFTVSTDANRKIKYVFQDPTDNKYTWYGGEAFDLKAGDVKTVNSIVDVTDKATCSTIQFNVNMGVIDDYSTGEKVSHVPTDEATITLSDFSLVEVTE